MISSTTDLAELHEIIQVAMGWTDSHMHQFIANGVFYGTPEPEFDFDVTPEYDVRIGAILKQEKDWLIYEYDFGDSWEHKIVLEKILPFNPKEQLPKCVTGRRGCPPEDVGGIWGYQEFLEAYNDTSHPEHEEMKEWAGEYFHPELFDKDEVNEIFSQASES